MRPVRNLTFLGLAMLLPFLSGCVASVESLEPTLRTNGVAAIQKARFADTLLVDSQSPKRLSTGWYEIAPGFHIADYEFEQSWSPILSNITLTETFQSRIAFVAEPGVAYRIRQSTWIGPGYRVQVWIEKAGNEEYVAGVKPTKVGSDEYFLHRPCPQKVCGEIYLCKWDQLGSGDFKGNLGKGCYLADSRK